MSVLTSLNFRMIKYLIFFIKKLFYYWRRIYHFQMYQPTSLHIFWIFSWISPSIQSFISFTLARLSVLLIKTTGTPFGIIWARNAKGITANEVPIIKTKSAWATVWGAVWKAGGSCYPKKIMSGLTNPLHSPTWQIKGSSFFRF